MFFDPTYMLFVLIPTGLLTMFAQRKVKKAFERWDGVRNHRGLDGAETARLIMQHAGLGHVSVERTPGHLTDHYDPRDRSINLSDSSTARPSVAAMAIVAHELGHAEQDATGNAMLRLRASLVPAARFGSSIGVYIIIGGVLLSSSAPDLGLTVAWGGVALFAGAVAFTLVTLPVEFDASRRARRWLGELGLVGEEERKGVDDVLNAAALTYVAAAAAAVANLMYWVFVLSGRRRD